MGVSSPSEPPTELCVLRTQQLVFSGASRAGVQREVTVPSMTRLGSHSQPLPPYFIGDTDQPWFSMGGDYTKVWTPGAADHGGPTWGPGNTGYCCHCGDTPAFVQILGFTDQWFLSLESPLQAHLPLFQLRPCCRESRPPEQALACLLLGVTKHDTLPTLAFPPYLHPCLCCLLFMCPTVQDPWACF